MIKEELYKFVFLIGIVLFPKVNYAQVDFNKIPDDDLGVVED